MKEDIKKFLKYSFRNKISSDDIKKLTHGTENKDGKYIDDGCTFKYHLNQMYVSSGDYSKLSEVHSRVGELLNKEECIVSYIVKNKITDEDSDKVSEAMLKLAQLKFLGDDNYLMLNFSAAVAYGKRAYIVECENVQDNIDITVSSFISWEEGFNVGEVDRECDSFLKGAILKNII